MVTESMCRIIFSQFDDIQTNINFLSFPVKSFTFSNRTLQIREKNAVELVLLLGFRFGVSAILLKACWIFRDG